MDKELGIEFVADPGHLDAADRDMLDRMIAAHQARVKLPDDYDATITANVNGAILKSIGESLAEPGYEYETSAKGFEQYLNDADEQFSRQSLFWLKDMVSRDNFSIAVQTLKELSPESEIPQNAYQQILERLMQLTPARLKEICDEIEVPVIILVPGNTFDEKIAAMDKNRHHNTLQNPAEVDPHLLRRAQIKSDRIRVCIIDGKSWFHSEYENPKTTVKEALISALKRLSRKQMQPVGPNEIAALYQFSLISSQNLSNQYPSEGGIRLVDHHRSDIDSNITILNFEDPDIYPDISFAYYSKHEQRFCFKNEGVINYSSAFAPPTNRNNSSYGTHIRPFMQLLEF